MTTTTTRPADDRVVTRSRSASFFSRPEVGALIGAVAVAVLFLAVAPAFRSANNIGTILYGSSTIGIMAVAVALLMIGGGVGPSAGGGGETPRAPPPPPPPASPPHLPV